MNKIGCLVPGADTCTYTENRLVGLTKVRKKYSQVLLTAPRENLII